MCVTTASGWRASGSALETVSAAGFGLALLMGLAAAVTVATVVRLGLLARRDEIEIMELVGAPLAYIRGPFVAEGLLQGGIGALLAILFLWLSHALTNAWWGTELRAILDGETVAVPADSSFGLPGPRRDGGWECGRSGGRLAGAVDAALTESLEARLDLPKRGRCQR